MFDDMMTVIREEAAKQYPKESCGVIVKRGQKSVTLTCANLAKDPVANFVMSVTDYATAADMGEVVGVWHTHTEIPAIPSEADRVGCNNSGLLWYIVSVSKTPDGFAYSEPTELLPDGFEMPYLERPYCAGVFDCYSVVRDYYKREFSVELGRYPYVREDGRPGHTFFVEQYEQEGFELLIDQEPQRGDVFILQISSAEPNHVVIYLGGDTILHHMMGRLSRRDTYGGFWTKHTTHHLRFKGLKC